MTEVNPNKKPSRRKRARKPDGTYQGNDPTTEVNEAWEPVDIAPELPKENKYAVKPKVTQSGDAGKYSKKPKVRPGLGKVTTTLR